MSIFLSAAHAADTTGMAAQGGATGTIIMFVGFFLIMYLLIWRPQSQRAKEHRELVESLAKGDEVITNGGLLGKVVKVKDDFVVLAIAEEVNITCQKSAIATSLPKGTLKSL